MVYHCKPKLNVALHGRQLVWKCSFLPWSTMFMTMVCHSIWCVTIIKHERPSKSMKYHGDQSWSLFGMWNMTFSSLCKISGTKQPMSMTFYQGVMNIFQIILSHWSLSQLFSHFLVPMLAINPSFQKEHFWGASICLLGICVHIKDIKLKRIR